MSALVPIPAQPNFDDVLNKLHEAQAAKAAADALAAQEAAQAQADALAAQQAAQAVQDAYRAPTRVVYSGNYGNSYDWGNCTWFVASRRSVPSDWGNANQWLYSAQASGWSTGYSPRVGAIAQTSAGYFGHVALVVGVGYGTVTVEEMNVMGLGIVDTQTYAASYFSYIY